jgi:hypothetical protein
VTLAIPLCPTSFIYTDGLYMSQVNIYVIKGGEKDVIFSKKGNYAC